MALTGVGLFSMARKIAKGEYGSATYRSNSYEGAAYNIGQWDGSAFCFDCSGLIKAILWGWCASTSDAYGGATYNSNGCPDINDAGFKKYCTNPISSVNTAPVGAILWLDGHVGIYGGNGVTVECTTAGRGGVQMGTVTTDGTRTVGGANCNGRNWAKWGCPTFIHYSNGTTTEEQEMTGSSSMSAADWRQAFIEQLEALADGWSYEGYPPTGGGCSDYVSQGLIQCGYCTGYSGSKVFWAANNMVGRLSDTTLFSPVSEPWQDGDILVEWGHHTAVYYNHGLLEATPAGSGHTHGGGAGWENHTNTCGTQNGTWTGYRLCKTGGSVASGAAWSGTPSGSSSGGTGSGTLDLHKYTLDYAPVVRYNANVVYVETQKEVTGDFIETVDTLGATTSKQYTNLLSTSTLVESPFVIMQVGDYTFGSYQEDHYVNGNIGIQFPNYITGLQVTKVNGSVNSYTISMTYQIQAGDNPNMIDEIFSTNGYNTIYLSYGDWNMPTFIYKKESALITKLSSKVNFANYNINYTITAVSNAVSTAAASYYWPTRNGKPSNIIHEILYAGNSKYKLLDVFPGMKDQSVVEEMLNGLNDATVRIEGKQSMDPISYLNYLVSCMNSVSSFNNQSVLKNATYYFVIHDDVDNERGGAYFTIDKVSTTQSTLASYDTYEIDIGFPDINKTNNNYVTDFQVNNDNSWALLYDYSEKVSLSNTVYGIDKDGQIYTEYSPNITTSTKTYTTTPEQRTWWTNMTQFPISATLTIKGLLRPSMLMTYLKVNTFFYGHKHITSGLYIITKEVDSINSGGYKTTLSLTRIAGDDDFITRSTKTVTHNLPVVTLQKEVVKSYTTEWNTTANNTVSVTYNTAGSSISSGGSLSGSGDTFTTVGAGKLTDAQLHKIESGVTTIINNGQANFDNAYACLKSVIPNLTEDGAIAILGYIQGESGDYYSSKGDWTPCYLHANVAINNFLTKGDAETFYSWMEGWGDYYSRSSVRSRGRQACETVYASVCYATSARIKDVYSAYGNGGTGSGSDPSNGTYIYRVLDSNGDYGYFF